MSSRCYRWACRSAADGLRRRVIGDRGENGLDLERREPGMLRLDARDEPGHMGRGEAVASRDCGTAVLPGNGHVDSPRAPLDRWVGVVEEDVRLGDRVRRN